MKKPKKPASPSGGMIVNDPLDWIDDTPPQVKKATRKSPKKAELTTEPIATEKRAKRPRTAKPLAPVNSSESKSLERNIDVTSNTSSFNPEILTGINASDAFDFLGTPITIADADLHIQYVNQSALDFFAEAESDIRKDLPDFRAKKMIGSNVDSFHTDPQHQRDMVAGLKTRSTGNLSLGGRHYGFIATPRYRDGVAVAYVLEWIDNTVMTNSNNAAKELIHGITKMSDAHDLGDIEEVIDAGSIAGQFGEAAKTINHMVGAHIDTKKKAIGFVTELANGNYDAELEKFPRKKAFINDALEAVRGNLKTYASEVELLIKSFKDMAGAHDLGDIDVVADSSLFRQEFADVVESVNHMVGAHIETKKKAIAFVTELANGNYDAELEKFPRKKAFINDALEAVRGNLKTYASEVELLIKSFKDMSGAHDLGDIDVVADSSLFRQEFADVVESVNHMVGAHIETKKKAIAFVTELANGNLDAELEQFPRKKAFINDALEAVRGNFKDIVTEVDRIASAIAEGNLDVPVDSTRYSGAFGQVVATMSEIITSVTAVVEEIDTLSNSIAQGRLDRTVDLSKYRGVYGDVMRAFENAFTSLNGAFGTVRSQIEQIATTVAQMTEASQALATNSQIQSSSVDEVSSSTEETESQVRSNATAALSARDLVVSASDMATDGKGKIEEMVGAMDGIRASSQDIAKIIKVIDEIAFQTNLLALNAAVEAARAGQHGRGFAVVAQEVRNLAGRSAKAARETSELIDSATTRVQVGVRIADETSHAFTSISDDIEKVRSLVNDIATASEEQSRGVAQINVAVSEIAKSALVTSQQADELATSASQMQASTESVTNEVARFNLRPMQSVTALPQGLENLPSDVLSQIQQMIAANASAPVALAKVASGGSTRNSDRDERGFGNF